MRQVTASSRRRAAEAREAHREGRRDPAPSRLAYRLNRLMLRRGVRTFLRFGLPVLTLAAAAAIWASDEARVQDARDRIAEMRRQVEERPEFMVRMMAVERASPPVAEHIREVLSVDFPVSSFDLDLAALRERVETLDAVAAASVRIRNGGVLEVEVTERIPSVIWRSAEELVLLDATGHRVAPVGARTERPDLPLIAGRGADRKVAEALELFAASDPIRERIRGFLRVGERRWDVVLDRDQRILLPEAAPVMALSRAIALDAAQDLLERDIAAVDFRNPRRPIIRLAAGATDTLFETGFDPDGDTKR